MLLLSVPLPPTPHPILLLPRRAAIIIDSAQKQQQHVVVVVDLPFAKLPLEPYKFIIAPRSVLTNSMNQRHQIEFAQIEMFVTSIHSC